MDGWHCVAGTWFLISEALLFLDVLKVFLCVCMQVKAAKLGHILVIDEADKAPTNVTCILKTLVESGEMILADGRRIISGTRTKTLAD